MRLTEKIAATFIFFPFASPFPVATDVQPLACIMCIVAIVIRGIKISKNDSVLIGFMIVYSAIFALYIDVDSNYDITKRLGMLSATVIVTYWIYAFSFLRINFILNLIMAHLFFMLMQWALPDIFDNYFANLIRSTTYVEGDARGVHGINAEPGGAAAVLGSLYFIYAYKWEQLNLKLVPLLKAAGLVIAGLAMTKSGLGIILATLILSHIILLGLQKGKIDQLLGYIIIISITLIFSFDLLLDGESNRGIQLVIESVNEFGGIIFADGSIAERVLGLAYGVYGLQYFPFGAGGGGYGVVAGIVEANHNLSTAFYSARSQIDSTVSTAGIYLAEYGLIFISFLLGLSIIYRPRKLSDCYPFVIALSFVFFSFSIAFPITWVLFAICYLRWREGNNHMKISLSQYAGVQTK